MTKKLRPFEITRGNDEQYIIKVDGTPASVTWNKTTFNELEKYHPGVNVDQEIIAMVIQELKLEFNLTGSEVREYTQTLKYILED
jgi:PP-loop superfamily ATP-utilizing enzyme